MIGIDDHLLAVCRFFRLFKHALFEPLMIDGHTIAFPFEQLDGIASTVDENEHATPFDLCIHKLLHQATESIKALTKICRPLEPKILRGSVEMQYAQAIRS